jgi:hypothetical protein
VLLGASTGVPASELILAGDGGVSLITATLDVPSCTEENRRQA